MNISEVFGVSPPKVAAYTGTAVTTAINPDLVIGLELETENCQIHSGTFYAKLCGPLNIMVEHDGSLRGVAYEFITAPMRSQDAIGCLGEFFNKSKFIDDNYSDRCSVHVHVNCTDMTLEQITNVALLYTTIEEILFEFVGGNRDTNIFCIPWNQCRQHFDLVHRFLNDTSYTLRNWNKYTALNLIPLSSQGTIEFRQLHGTSDMAKITTWINIIGAIFAYAKSVQLNTLIARIKELNTSSFYEMFFNDVLGGQLPYNEVYSRKLEEGIIFAKYSLMSYKEGTVAAPRVIKKKAVTMDEWARFEPVHAEMPLQEGAVVVDVADPIREAERTQVRIDIQRTIDRMRREVGLNAQLQPEVPLAFHQIFTANTGRVV